MSLPSETTYPQYEQIEGCTVAAREFGHTTIIPACLGGVGTLGCVRLTECQDIAWSTGGNQEIAEKLIQLHRGEA